LCAPSRQALLTGRNHHSVGMGAVPDLATSAPGYNSVRPKAAAPLAEVLKLNYLGVALDEIISMATGSAQVQRRTEHLLANLARIAPPQRLPGIDTRLERVRASAGVN
jgi:Sulfatase